MSPPVLRAGFFCSLDSAPFRFLALRLLQVGWNPFEYTLSRTWIERIRRFVTVERNMPRIVTCLGYCTSFVHLFYHLFLTRFSYNKNHPQKRKVNDL